MTYKGQLLGGPLDKTIVESSVGIITTHVTVDAALSGDVAYPLRTIIEGQYIWQVKGEYFLWNRIRGKSYKYRRPAK